ncbi:hypothetical protein DYB37_008338 [Aphanomyces astaci]|uniref:Uncharacterized protein n=1 Tax=Aphanomyces astaci TaxID=112090 RepID=A0A397DVF9_APHAT|nr:hypothetical protein DYB34_003603 [Aphanomyces astaci]RHY68887.1 hypothetical protein DYB38_013124 [Aphanomyces astaci]RHY85858.1 hypothetical protein DYB35_007014 [Aphanomyces astaci]RHZ30782.1 hypothetical protein DYB37_008338 [Aphanomyces astaci]RHZ38081.1 hypothetical protein DYB31_007633 [Aphanomyces astaci]
MHAEVERELARLRHAMRDLNKNVQKLSDVNNELVAFNHSFGTFCTAINLQKTCVEFPLPSPPPKKAAAAPSSNSAPVLSIGELVKASNISVIHAKDILQTLMKLEQIKCKREKHGFLYCRS